MLAMENALDRLGRLVRERRLALDLSQRDAAVRAKISNQTWLNVENGRSVSERTLSRIERVLDWSPGTIETILAGKPSPSAPETVLDLTVLGNLSRLAEVLRAEDLTHDEIQQVITRVVTIVDQVRRDREPT
jgi:transcriptional regulator with XRE-family HTH domain